MQCGSGENMNNTFKTPKGTDLPFLVLKGKQYLQVAHRLVWFREDHPDWAIETNVVSHSDDKTIAKAVIKDPSGRALADGYKQETQKDFSDHLEKALTGAIGRALAVLGYGTAHAQELDEEHRIVDAPVTAPVSRPQYSQPMQPAPQQRAPVAPAPKAPIKPTGVKPHPSTVGMNLIDDGDSFL